ncbi:MAG: VOC family protein [Dehalococcoidia bacterium]
MFKIARLNHAVLYVRDAQVALAFYRDVLGFTVVEEMGPQAIFLRASGSENHHDLGLFGIGVNAPGPSGGRQVGLYHLAWQVDALPELAEARLALLEAGAMTGEADHGSSLSLYGRDPDGNEFEVFWLVPREEWATRGFGTRPLNLEGELRRRGLAEATA